MPMFRELAPGLFQWTSTCHSYVVKDGDHGLLIDLGDGTVLDHLGEIGVTSVDWVLFTHHHREQCQGGVKLAKVDVQTACGANEKQFFENPGHYRRMRPKLGDPFTVHGTSYVRPPVTPIRIDRTFSKMDTFEWRGREFWCIETPGDAPGHMTYCFRHDGDWRAFSGDLMCDGAKLHTWFDVEWDYGFAAGIYALGNSAGQLLGYQPEILYPSHGPVIERAAAQLTAFITRLQTLAKFYVRGYDINRFAGCDQDNVSRPSAVPHLWQVSKHLYKFRGPNYWVNFAMILSDSGRALFVDCGLFNREFLDATIEQMRERLGLKAIDAIFVTHMHGDHALDADHIRQKYGAEIWGMEGVVDKFSHAYDYDLSALLPMYGGDAAPIAFDRVLADGETIQWENFQFTCDWMPGQTKYHSCLHGVIDEQVVAFTGDNIFANPRDAAQGGNECVLARNGGVLEEGYLYAASYLHALGPDVMIGGHCWAMKNPAELIERFRVRMENLRAAFQELCTEDDYRLTFDPYQVEAYPYRSRLEAGGSGELVIRVRNWRDRAMKHRLALHLPAGLSVNEPVLSGVTDADGFTVYRIQLTADNDAADGMRMVAIDATFDGHRRGEWFDFLVQIGDSADAAAKPPEKSEKAY